MTTSSCPGFSARLLRQDESSGGYKTRQANEVRTTDQWLSFFDTLFTDEETIFD
jgi:hypothetical protein